MRTRLLSATLVALILISDATERDWVDKSAQKLSPEVQVQLGLPQPQ